MTEAQVARVRAELPRLLSDLQDLIRIQSVSADPARRSEVQRSAEKVQELFAAEGFEAEVVTADGGAPAVIATKRSRRADAPTVLLYAHHDVQPENDHADWDTPPWEPTERDGRLYARGAADDKAGIAAHLGAVRVFGDDLPVHVTMFIEGEEEVGSESLTALLAAHRDRLQADVIVIADSANWDIGVPALTTSLRGLVRADVEVRTLTHAVHSGMWGGLVPDALITLSRLIASLHDDEGSVAVAGLHSGPAADVDYPEARLRAESGALPGVTWIGTGPAVQRLWTKPSLSVIGLDAPKVDGASNTLVPAARAKLSLRIAPGDTTANAVEALRRHCEQHVPWGAELTFTVVDTGEATLIDATGPAYDAARSAFTQAWDGTSPIDMGIGGSIPFIAEFLETFPRASVLVTGVEDPDTRAHGANEGLHLAEFERVVELADSLGGGTRSAELMRPGVLHDICSAVHPMALASPFFRSFALADRIDLRVPEISYAHMVTPSVSGIAHRDLDRTAHDLGVDGRAWHRFFRPILDRIDGVVDLASGPLLQLPGSPVAAAVLGLRALETGSSLLWNLRFREAIAPAMLVGVAAHAIGPMPRPAQSGAGLLLAALAHHGGWPVPVGGSQAIADAMIDDIVAHGGTLETGVEITDLAEVEDARAVLLDVSPRALARIGGRRLPDRYVRALERYRYGDAAAKVDLVLSGPVPWSDPQVSGAPTLHLGGTRGETATAEKEVAAGRVPQRPYVLLAQQAVLDPSRTRDGLHPIWAYTHLPNDSALDPTDLVLNRIEQFAPGVRELVVDSRSTTAAALGRYNPNYVGGDIASGAVDLRQLVARPVLSPTPWRTPAAGVYLCSSATPPGPGVTGMSGWHAARTALRDVFGLGAPDLSPTPTIRR